MPKQRFVILLAHGSSDPNWLEPFTQLEQRIQQGESQVRLAYMELAEPSLETVISEAHKAGHQSFVILPLFFAAGRHLRQDVPSEIDEVAHRLGVEILLLPPVGEHPSLADALLHIVRESISAAQQS